MACEFPDIRIISLATGVPVAESSSGLLEELALAANRVHGSDAVRAATRPVPAAYRAAMRQFGMDPNEGPLTALDAVMRRRLVEGGFRKQGTVADAMTIVSLELGVPLVAFAEDRVEGVPGISRVQRTADGWAEGELVIADAERPIARLFRDPPPEESATGSGRALLVAVGVVGVPPEVCEAALERANALIC